MARRGAVVLMVMLLLIMACGLSSLAVADVVRSESRVASRERRVALRELALGGAQLSPGTELQWGGRRVRREADVVVVVEAGATWRFEVDTIGEVGGAIRVDGPVDHGGEKQVVP